MKLSIVIPVYNEEKTLLTVLKKVQAVNIGNILKEIILVDDCSKDNTRAVMKRLRDPNIKIFYHQENQGKGAAVLTGFKHTTGDIILIQDADMEYDPNDYPKLIKPIIDGDADVVFGSRFMKQRGAVYHLYYLGNRLISIFASIIYLHKLSDVETCYKAFSKESLKKLLPTLRSQRFDLEPELAAKVVKNKFRLAEVSVWYKGRTFEEGKKITWKDGVKALYYLLKYRVMD
ncbi:MAG TPA: glycosyltransferase family 2 protein [Candidatus Nanoarchaeia archaeon]|nr:glycosyltransferase family 2 protein [Candidatus Nanoarchaeia archaeon]